MMIVIWYFIYFFIIYYQYSQSFTFSFNFSFGLPPPGPPHLSLGVNSVIRLQPQNQRGRDRKSRCKKQKCITKYIIWFIFSTKMCIKRQNMFVKSAQLPHLYNKGFKWGNFEIDFNKNHLIDRDSKKNW